MMSNNLVTTPATKNIGLAKACSQLVIISIFLAYSRTKQVHVHTIIRPPSRESIHLRIEQDARA